MTRKRYTPPGEGREPRLALELARCFRAGAKSRRGRGDGWRNLLDALGRSGRSGRPGLDLPERPGRPQK